ncbi:hypothetical protein FOZ63_012093, partial [Perkinsus olseni]
KNPCNDIETRKRFRVEFTADKEVYHYVQHTGALLAVGTILRPTGHTQNLQQSKDSNVIDRLSYSISLKQGEDVEDGKLVVGGTPSNDGDTVHIRLWRRSESYRKIFIPIVAVRLIHNDNVTRQSFPRGFPERFSPQPLPRKLHLIDSGTSVIDVPRSIFDAVVRNLKATVAAFDPTDAKVHDNILWEGDDLPVQLIRPSHVKFLPTIIYSVIAEGGDIVDIRISPKHYVGSCSEAKCAVYISVTERTLVCLGQPFFRAYITHVDLEDKLLSITPYHRRQ